MWLPCRFDNGMHHCQQHARFCRHLPPHPEGIWPQLWKNIWLAIERSKCTAQVWGENPGKLVCSVRDVIRVFFPTLLSCFYIYHLHLLQTTTKRLPKVNRSVARQVSNQSHPGDVMHLRKLESKSCEVTVAKSRSCDLPGIWNHMKHPHPTVPWCFSGGAMGTWRSCSGSLISRHLRWSS